MPHPLRIPPARPLYPPKHAKERERHEGGQASHALTAAALLAALVGRFADLEDLALAGGHGAAAFVLVEGLGGDDAVDFCVRGVSTIGLALGWRVSRGDALPVRMFWNASSTFEASSAEVSMKERLFSPVCADTH
jgi:hypothetical protein